MSESIRLKRGKSGHTKVSSGSKNNVKGLPSPQATITKTGITNNEIWMQDPTATFIAKSNFPLLATTTAVVCSAALEMMGMTMRVIHSLLTEECSTRPLMLSTRFSAVR